MNIITISPNGYLNPHLFPTYRKTFEQLGHTFTDNPFECSHCFIEVVSGTINYPPELKTIIERQIPIYCFDNREFSVMGTGKWKPIDLPVDIYFVRTMIKGEQYPENVFPYDWAYFNNCDYPPTSKEELFNRPYDVCFIGVEAPTRTNIINGLLKDGRLKVKHIFNDHLTRLPHEQWINGHREAKFYLEAEGGGLASEKFLQLFSVAAMLKGKNKHDMAFPFTDKKDCLEINEHQTKEDIDKILEVVNDKERLYQMFVSGHNHMKTYYSEEAISNYVLSKL